MSYQQSNVRNGTTNVKFSFTDMCHLLACFVSSIFCSKLGEMKPDKWVKIHRDRSKGTTSDLYDRNKHCTERNTTERVVQRRWAQNLPDCQKRFFPKAFLISLARKVMFGSTNTWLYPQKHHFAGSENLDDAKMRNKCEFEPRPFKKAPVRPSIKMMQYYC